MPRMPRGKPKFADRNKIVVNDQRVLNFEAEIRFSEIPIAPPIMGSYDTQAEYWLRPDPPQAYAAQANAYIRPRPVETVPPHLRALASDIAFLEERLAHEAQQMPDADLAACSLALDTYREEMRRHQQRYHTTRIPTTWDPYATSPGETYLSVERRTDVPPARVLPPPAGGTLSYEMMERAVERYIHLPSAPAGVVTLPAPTADAIRYMEGSVTGRMATRVPNLHTARPGPPAHRGVDPIRRQATEAVEDMQQREARLMQEMADIGQPAQPYPAQQQRRERVLGGGRRSGRGASLAHLAEMEQDAADLRQREERERMEREQRESQERAQAAQARDRAERFSHGFSSHIYFVNPDEWT